jgi:NADH:ubiquinone reductase (non-electrogenic)
MNPALSLARRRACARPPLSHLFRRQQTVAPRRFYADAPRPTGTAPKVTPPPPPPPRPQPQPKRKRGAFRSALLWGWRATYLSAAGALAYVGYGVYQLRNPAEQLEPAPGKKQLVVLGAFFPSPYRRNH